MAEEEEMHIEVEAVQSVYGDDCVVFDSFPPHLRVHIKPRTADVYSQQFVEAVLEISGGPQYPKEPPHIELIESKGLDEQRQKHLVTCIRDKAHELSSYFMLVALCEEAVEKLSTMNHPDGNCPLCLYPLIPEDDPNNTFPFMKLMSCFHCFHSECIIRWWKWLQTEKETNSSNSSSATEHPTNARKSGQDMHGLMGDNIGNCPVCRKVFHAKDFEHVLDLVGTHASQLVSDGTEFDDNETLLQSESENARRQKFEATLNLQQENSGLIEPEKSLLVLPGMFLPPQPVTSTTTVPTQEVQPQRDMAATSETNSSGSQNRRSAAERRSSGMRRPRGRNSRKPVKQQWIRKENGSAD